MKYDFSREYNDPQEKAFGEPIMLDRHRIIHSTAFRRLGYKTQVFVPFEADHFRTRLTHTVEVAHLSALLSLRFNANSNLAQAISLAHDLGHSPFGHTGEHTLNKLLENDGGFEHNQQSLRVVQYLERPYPWFVGLNLTKATIEGLKSHSTPYDRAGKDIPTIMIEAQIANWADRIAYDASDIEDAFGAGLIRNEDMLQLALYKRVWHELDDNIRNKPIPKIRRVICERLQMAIIDALTVDSNGIMMLDNEISAQLEQMEKFLLENVYLHRKLTKISEIVEQILMRLFNHYVDNPELLPKRFLERQNVDSIKRIVADYIAGMTDRFCLKTYQNLFNDNSLPNQLKSYTISL